MASLTHTVLFQFKAKAEAEHVKEACTRFLSLKDQCIHPTTQSPYILSLKGGKDNSPEGLQVLNSSPASHQIMLSDQIQNGITHGFVVEFASAADRDYYVSKDPAHQAFVKSIGDLVDKAIVVDFENAVY
ncbi:dabb-domain-containing protein [Paramyrothecium foliicola]|nr:dabb-domain-containing protein [Paramyrothecium foliicola]